MEGSHHERGEFVSRYEFDRVIEGIYKEMRHMADATQADIDQLVTELNTVSTDLNTAQTTLQTEIDNLANSVPAGVDLTALKAAADALDPAVQALGNLVPTPPAPVDPDPAPDAPAEAKRHKH